MRFATPEALVAALLDLRAKQRPERASRLVQASLAARGHPYAEDLWSVFFDPDESFADAMHHCGCALWELSWSDRHDLEPQAALLALEASNAAGLEAAGFPFAEALDHLGDLLHRIGDAAAREAYRIAAARDARIGMGGWCGATSNEGPQAPESGPADGRTRRSGPGVPSS